MDTGPMNEAETEYAWLFATEFRPVARTVYLIVHDRGRAEDISLGQVTQFINGGILSDGFMGSFVVEGDRVVLTSFDGYQLTLGYRLKGDELTFTLDEPASGTDAAFDAALWSSHPWERR